MTALELAYGSARITEPDLDILPGRASDLPDLVNLAGGEPHEGTVTGVRALLLALLEDAIRCYLSPIPKLRIAAERWVEGHQRDVPLTFELVCASFGLDPGATRKILRQHRLTTGPKAFGRSRPNVRHNIALALRVRRRARPSRARRPRSAVRPV